MNLQFNHGGGRVSAARTDWSPAGCDDCSDYLLEAWERMKTGGVEVPYYQEGSLRGIVRVGGGAFFHAARRF